MDKKKAFLISCSDHYDHRLHVVDEYLQSCGFDTTYITSDFDHTAKTRFACKVQGCVQLRTKAYQKNLSVARILSHWMFARSVFRYLEALTKQPDLVVALIPPNYLAHHMAKYKKKHPGVKLVFDIFDLWPETFPSGKAKKLLAPAFKVWAWIRDHSLSAADYITTECEMFRERLKLPEEKSETVYLCAEPLEQKIETNLSRERLDLCYLGAINNIIDIPGICRLIEQLAAKKPVTLHIIGKGERQQEFIDSAKAAGAQVEFYGAVYDDETKQEIMSKCHFGLNVMKSSVCVGLTMKSVDYFRHGLPIINNIPADTQSIVEGCGVGVQMNADCSDQILALTNEACMTMRENVKDVFEKHFLTSVIIQQNDEIFTKLL